MTDKEQVIINKAREVCQWLDFHYEQVSDMTDEAREAIQSMHDSIIDYEVNELKLPE